MLKKTRLIVAAVLASALMCPSTAWATIEGDQEAVSDEEIAEALASGVIKGDDPEGVGSDARVLSARSSGALQSFSGALRFDTSAMEALAAFSSSEHAIIAGGEGWPDALAASTLAGALSCPIMLTPGDSLHGAVADALSQLGVNHVIVVGDKNAVSDEVVAQLGTYGAVERVSGTTRYETQLAIYQYGLDKGLWASDFVIVANGGSAHFADALSASPFAYRAKAPVFFVADDGQLPAGQEAALVAGAKRGLFKKAVIVGDENSVSQQAEGFIRGIGVLSTGLSATSVERLAGADRYATSAAIATWAVGNGYLSWDKAAFATGSKPYDALGGGALQGESGSVMLLVDEGALETIDAMRHSGSAIGSVRFFGDKASVSASVRMYVADVLGAPYTEIDGLKIYVDAGHGWNDSNNGAYDPGAMGSGYEEATLTKELAGLVGAELRNRYGVDVYVNDDGGYYKYRHAEARSLGCDMIVSIHFNAGGGSGTESLIHSYNAAWRSSALQAAIHPSLVKATTLADRGKKTQQVAILGGPLPATLLEIGFIDNAFDMAVYQANKAAIARAIASSALSE